MTYLMQRGAVLSEDEVYRYELHRHWPSPWKGTVCWVMLNPSTADSYVDDPTIRRCIAYSKEWGYDTLSVVNLYALRATDPIELVHHEDPVGPNNDRHIVEQASTANLVVVGWGSFSTKANQRGHEVAHLLAGHTLWCLGTNKDGSPKHPLYLAAVQPLVEWRHT